MCGSFAWSRVCTLPAGGRAVPRQCTASFFRPSCAAGPAIDFLSHRHYSNYSANDPYRSHTYLDPYKVLKVSSTATAKDIKQAFWRESKKCHPDLHPGT